MPESGNTIAQGLEASKMGASGVAMGVLWGLCAWVDGANGRGSENESWRELRISSQIVRSTLGRFDAGCQTDAFNRS